MTQVVIVTGGSRGIGAATAVSLGSYRTRVVLAGRDADALAAVGDRVQRGGGTVLTMPGDLTSERFAQQLVAAALGEFGRVDAVINNAGVVGEVVHMSEASADSWRSVYEVNVLAALAMVRAALPALRAAGGRVVNVTSEVAAGPAESIGAYAASKAALSSLTRTLAIEEPDITAIGYQPGPVHTDLMATILRAAPDTMSAAMAEGYRRLAAGGFVDLAATSAKLALLAMRAPRAWTGRIVDHADTEIDGLAAG
jgi:NAD(P)-dependent dehydrogenase (short-subunit alcohol dehydrogenase family)